MPGKALLATELISFGKLVLITGVFSVKLVRWKHR